MNSSTNRKECAVVVGKSAAETPGEPHFRIRIGENLISDADGMHGDIAGKPRLEVMLQVRGATVEITSCCGRFYRDRMGVKRVVPAAKIKALGFDLSNADHNFRRILPPEVTEYLANHLFPVNTQLVRVSRQANDYIAGWFHRQPVVKEESITDWLLDYFDQNSPDVHYYEFDRHEEAHFSGADWDWWFLLRTGCFKIRVQAKKLRRGKDHYPELARSNQKGYQIDLLLNSSAAHNFYPLYVLYAKTEGVERCRRVPEPTVLSVCSAQETYQLIFGSARKRIDSGDVLALTIPLECLFRCPLACDVSSHGPEKLFRHYFQTAPRGLRGEEVDRRGYEERVPDIIRSLADMPEINDNTERILREYQSMFSGSRGIKIVRADHER